LALYKLIYLLTYLLTKNKTKPPWTTRSYTAAITNGYK